MNFKTRKTRAANFIGGYIRLYPDQLGVTMLYSMLYNVWIPSSIASGWLSVPCSSKRKFRRLLKKWSVYLPPGTRFVLNASTPSYSKIKGVIR